MSEGRQKAHSAFLHVLFCSGSRRTGWCSPALGKVICFAQSSNSNANLFPNTLTDKPRNNVLPTLGYPLAQPSWHLKLTITVSEERPPTPLTVTRGQVSPRPKARELRKWEASGQSQVGLPSTRTLGGRLVQEVLWGVL